MELRTRPSLGLGAALIGDEEKQLVMDVLNRQEPFRYYGQGSTPPPMVASLEQEFSAMMGTQYALAVTSGTAALEVALGALGVGPGDEVIVPVWSWVSCFTAIVRVGALPVLAEIDETFCLAPGEITRLSTPATKAVMIVHYQGVAADMEPLLAEARSCGIRVLEDCAESAGASYRGQRVGTIGDIGIYSFQNNKTITSGEGGMVVTDDPLLYERAVRMHDIGSLRPFHARQVEAQVPSFCGSQFRMSELTGALALAQLRKLDGIREHCRTLSNHIIESIRDLERIEFRSIPDPDGDSGVELYLLLPNQEMAEAFTGQLDALNINCQKTTGTYCQYAREYCRLRQVHASSASPFAKFDVWPAVGYREKDFPRTNDLIARFVALPIGVSYTRDDAEYISQCIRHVHSNISRHMSL